MVWIGEVEGYGENGLELLVGMAFSAFVEGIGLDRSGSALMIRAMAAVSWAAVLANPTENGLEANEEQAMVIEV